MKSLPVIQPSSPAAAPESTRPLQTEGMANDPERKAALMPEIVKALSSVFDPEIPVNIYDLGLVYDVIVDTSNRGKVTQAIEAVPGVTGASVDVVWDPPWTRDRMSEAARLQLGMF